MAVPSYEKTSFEGTLPVRLYSHSSTHLSKPLTRSWIALAVGICGLVVSACNGPASSFLPEPQRSLVTKPLSVPTPTPIPFKFQIVDDPNSTHNQVNGINNLSKIVGTYGAGQGSNIDQSYTSASPYTKFLGLDDPGAQGTVATSLSSNKEQAGYVIVPSGLTGTWAFVRVGGLWSLLSDPNEGTGNNAVTEILGLNDKGLAVGFYVNGSGTQIPIEINIPNTTYTELQPPGALDAEATGINGLAKISGWETTTSNVTQGWYLQSNIYYTFSYPGSQTTYALSLNTQDQVVGYYTDANKLAHGFLLIGPYKGGAKQIWQTIDAPHAAGGTWVTGINSHDDICGYFVDGSGIQHGFVAVP
jgi:hypothetical protein